MIATIVFGQTKEEHDLRLKAALERFQRAGVTLNKEKYEFGKEKLTFLGHLVDSQGIQAEKMYQNCIDFWEWLIKWENSSLIWLSSHNLYVSYLKRT